VLPVPHDWPDTVCVTGYWFLDDNQGWSPDDALSAFLAAGDAPVYVGFGSMPGLDPVAMTKVVVEALKIVGKRGVIATSGGALGEVPVSTSQVHVIEGAPHDKLFPLMSACVHHGGAGSTAASLRAGKPTVVCPFFGDQPFWGWRVEELGVGPAPIDKKKLSIETLAAAITSATSDTAMAGRANELGIRIAGEDGVGNAIAFLQRRRLLSVTAA
jgi:UDP:flavonoid glycosyltransferase YjiC (YdhE family)